jgi:3-isopropylmalate/(R)-2-methylmalate dehydratase small subunit
MESLQHVVGLAVPLMQPDIDTEQIIPGRDLVRVEREGYAQFLFFSLRYRDGKPDPTFILNQEPWSSGVILIAGKNFGSGSSREAAPKALREFGFRCVIAPSFGGIFYNNCFRNGLLPVELSSEDVRQIALEVERGPTNLEVDLEANTVRLPSGRSYEFEVPPMLREMLLQGLDEINLTLSYAAEIEQFRAQDRARRPWVYNRKQTARVQ